MEEENLDFLDDENEDQKIQPVRKITFLRADDHELEPLLKALKKVSKKSVQRMIEGLNSSDEKIALDAAKFLLTMQINVSKEINTDAMNRTIAEIRFNQQSLPSIREVSGANVAIDFNKIQDV